MFWDNNKKLKDTSRKLKKKSQELLILQNLDKFKENASDTNVFLNSVLTEFMKILNTEMGIIFLYNNNELEIGASKDRGVFNSDNYQLMKIIAQDSIEKGRIMVINDTTLHIRIRKFGIRNILSCPIRFNNETIGVFVLLNKKRTAFNRRDLNIFSLMLNSIDSTIKHSSVYKKLESTNKELSTLYAIDKLRDTIKDFDTLMNAVLEGIINTLDTKIGFIAFYNKDKELIEFKVPSNIKMSSFLKDNQYDLDRICKIVFEKADLVKGGKVNNDIINFIAVPAVLENSIAIFGAINTERINGFNKNDETLIKAIATQMDSAIFEDIDKQKIKSIFKRYVSPEVMDTILKDDNVDYLKTEKHDVSVLFADIRGFTAMSEKLAAEEVVEMLNDYFSAMASVIMNMRGTLDKFMGDGIMAIFGAPIYYDGHALKAVKTAIEMQAVFKKLQQKWKKEGKPIVELGIGINTGIAVVGNIGSKLRTDYTAIGDVVNTSARLCGKAIGGQILIPDSTKNEINGSIITNKMSAISVKGKKDPIDIYEVIGNK